MTQQTTSSDSAVARNPNARARAQRKRKLAAEAHIGRYATAGDAFERLAATFDRVRSGVRNAPADRRVEMAEEADRLMRTFCKTHQLP